MSKADEMFKKLGYTTKVETTHDEKLITIEYKKECKYSIVFNTVTRETFICGFDGIELEELQAINEKCKELGWITKM